MPRQQSPSNLSCPAENTQASETGPQPGLWSRGRPHQADFLPLPLPCPGWKMFLQPSWARSPLSLQDPSHMLSPLPGLSLQIPKGAGGCPVSLIAHAHLNNPHSWVQAPGASQTARCLSAGTGQYFPPLFSCLKSMDTTTLRQSRKIHIPR